MTSARSGPLIATATVAGLTATAVSLGALHRRDAARLAGCRHAEVLDGRPMGEVARVRSSDGTDLHVEVAGAEDAPPVVLIHGWGMSARFWYYQMRDLADDHRVVAFDLRGHGRSGRPGSLGTTFAGLTADLDAVLEGTGLADRRPVVAGHSLGGMTAIAWTGTPPDGSGRTRALALFNTACRETCAGALAERPRLSRIATAVNRATIAAPGRLPRHTPISHRIAAAIAHGADAAPSHVALTERLFVGCDPEVRAGFGRLLGTFDLTEQARRISAPATVVLGTRDRLIAPGFSRRLAEVLPQGTLVELPGIGHQAPLEAHDEVTAILRELARH